MDAGGESFRYIPALNDRKDHINCLIQLIQDKSSGWLN
jgi:ferrochelatase